MSAEEKLASLEALIASGLLREPRGKLPRNTYVVRDLETALFFTGRRRRPLELKDHEIPVDLQQWEALTEKITAKHGLTSERGTKIANLVEQEIDKRHIGDDVAEEAGCDFIIIAGHLVCDGGESRLGALLLAAYKAGAWPCGWAGKYPEGNLIVYWPYEVPPEFESSPITL